jgi:hypothetical protein
MQTTRPEPTQVFLKGFFGSFAHSTIDSTMSLTNYAKETVRHRRVGVGQKRGAEATDFDRTSGRSIIRHKDRTPWKVIISVEGSGFRNGPDPARGFEMGDEDAN